MKGIRRLRVSDLRRLQKSFLAQADSGHRRATSTPTRPTPTRPASTTPDAAPHFDTPERARADPNTSTPDRSLLQSPGLDHTPVAPDFDPFDDSNCQLQIHGQEKDSPDFPDLDYEEQNFDLGGNWDDNDLDMPPSSSTGGRPAPSWETRLKEIVLAPEVDVKPEDMMSLVVGMVGADGGRPSYGTRKAGLVFDCPLPPGHRFPEISKYDKIVIFFRHVQANGQWTFLHVVNYSAGIRKLVGVRHFDCLPDRQRLDMVEGFVDKAVADFMPDCEISFTAVRTSHEASRYIEEGKRLTNARHSSWQETHA